MDIDLLRDGGHFSTFDSGGILAQYSDEMTHLEGFQNEFEWNLDSERQINGDIALIPVCDLNLTSFDNSPPSVDEFHKTVNDWQQFINVDVNTESSEEPVVQSQSGIIASNIEYFDLTSYLSDTDSVSQTSSINTLSRKHKAGIKKIDLEAQKYIIDEDDVDVDVETISESEESSPVLEAKDLNSLLEQFEATQIPELPVNFIENDPNLFDELGNEHNSDHNIDDHMLDVSIIKNIKQEQSDEIEIEEHMLVKKEIDNDHKYELGRRKENTDKQDRKIDKNIKLEKIIESRIESNKTVIQAVKKEDKSGYLTESKVFGQSNISISTSTVPQNVQLKPSHIQNSTSNLQQNSIQPSIVPISTPESTTSPSPNKVPISTPESTTSPSPNKQILDSLPKELIDRIKESGKRKSISVIPPIPTRKRKAPRTQENVAQLNKSKMIKLIDIKHVQLGLESVQLDHDYCSPKTLVETYPKIPQKDSGFGSAEEDDRTMIGKQPTVKNADGKLMVSLLKVNTIHTPMPKKEKKKLNLEEYKKRREGFFIFQNNSQNSSPISSNCSSPVPEDLNTKLLKHQEKLMRMAKEVLNTPPKGEKTSTPTASIVPTLSLKIPEDMEKKEFFSIGVNTDFKVPSKNWDPLVPVDRLDEIKPLLQKASGKINSNSLITSVIETIPKFINTCDSEQSKLALNKDSFSNDKMEPRENKTIMFLPKNREAANTYSVGTQTNISLIQQTKANRYRRRRQSSDSSCSSHCSKDSRGSRSTSRDRSSNDSRGSSRNFKSSRSLNSRRSSSSYSSRSSSRSRSRSKSPRYSPKDKDKIEKKMLREVEERRVIYVGRVPPGTTREDLKRRFQKFGAITNVSLHSRDHSYLDNYGFVTFANKLDAYDALEHGNDDPLHPKYDLSFGGRRIFCQTSYSDLDNMRDECGFYTSKIGKDDSFDKLLREMQEKLRKRKA